MSESAAEGSPATTPPTASFHKEHLRSFSRALSPPADVAPTTTTTTAGEASNHHGGGSNGNNDNGRASSSDDVVVPPPPSRSRALRRLESGHELTVTASRTKARQRKYVGAYRRATRGGDRDDDDRYDAWRGRVGVRVEYDEIDLRGFARRMRETTTTPGGGGGGWELVDCYDVVRMWLPAAASRRGEPQSKPEPDLRRASSGLGEDEDDDDDDHHHHDEGGYDEGEGREIHASMPEVFVFGFGAVVFWNLGDEYAETAWMERHLSPLEGVLGLRHNPESIEAAKDEMGFCYGDAFRWRRDVVQLRTRDAGEKMAVSFAFAKSANLSVFEWRMEQAVRRNAFIPEALAEHGELHLRRNEIDAEIGRLYLLNNAINLTTNMLDTPESCLRYFLIEIKICRTYSSEDDRFQPEYDKTIKYLDVLARINLLNRRLDVLKDLNTILMDAAQNHHAATLEWIVIILIIAWLTVAR
ncbi:hypothetical protein ACHAW5_003762 [Stephanodiscus triporus]|uniref:DUF155 domain-containing protein n=1 Tax=Stephanodiscus triporus TaxID=2934178 RepID=A0ABD3PDV4_9STRA